MSKVLAQKIGLTRKGAFNRASTIIVPSELKIHFRLSSNHFQELTWPGSRNLSLSNDFPVFVGQIAQIFLYLLK